jgi:hypothetical protein
LLLSLELYHQTVLLGKEIKNASISEAFLFHRLGSTFELFKGKERPLRNPS